MVQLIEHPPSKHKALSSHPSIAPQFFFLIQKSAGHQWLKPAILAGSRDHEDHGLKSSEANNLQDPILKKTQNKKCLVKWLRV
jgi:hypothetical protein